MFHCNIFITFYFILFVNLNVATITSMFVWLRIINCYFYSIWVGSVDSALSRRELQSRVNLFFMPGVLTIGLIFFYDLDHFQTCNVKIV